jgi:hypothetical protein
MIQFCQAIQSINKGLLDRRCFPIVPGKHPNLFLENIQRKTPMDQPLCLRRLGAFKQYRRFLQEGKRRMPGW